jgi:hypothetical protein
MPKKLGLLTCGTVIGDLPSDDADADEVGFPESQFLDQFSDAGGFPERGMINPKQVSGPALEPARNCRATGVISGRLEGRAGKTGIAVLPATPVAGRMRRALGRLFDG